MRGFGNNVNLTNGCYDDSISVNSSGSAAFAVFGTADSLDEPDEVVTLTFTDDPDNPRPSGVAQINVSSTITIRDDDPTIVSLARVGSGAVTEGAKVEFTVTLGRALIAGETIDVPLSIGGTSVTTGDWSLALKSSATNTGVTLSDAGMTTPEVSFTNAGAQSATLELTATADGTAENAETFEIALGANSAFDDTNLDTNVGGGADPHGTNNDFDVTVNNNDAPTVANAIPNQTATVGTAFSFQFAANTFSDANGDSLTYTAAKSDDTALPTWLTFTAVTRTFSGTPQAAHVGTLSVKVTANDGNSGTVSDTFDIVVSAAANNAPRVANAIPNQTATAGTAFSFQFPANTFSDADSDSLTYTAAKSDGTALPSWLTFTAVTRTFSGTPQAAHVGPLSVKVTANDGNSGTVSDTFDIVVSNAAPTTPTITIAGGSAVTEGTAASFTLTASPAPSANLDIRVNVTQSGSFVASGDRGTKTVTIASGQTSKTFTVPTQGNSTDEPNGSVTATVNIGTGYTVGPASSATVTIRDDDTAEVGPTPFISLSLTSGDGRCTYQNADLTFSTVTGPQYDCVRATSVDETDSAPVNVEFYVRTSQLSSSALPFRVCFSGTATPPTGDRAEQDYLVQERVGSAWQTRNSTCVDSSIAANQHHRKLRIQVLGDDHYEHIPMWVDGRERPVISGTEWVGVQLAETPGKKLPSPYEINSARTSLGVTINDDDYRQQPLAFGTWAGKPGVREGRPSPEQDVGIAFSAQAGWKTTVTYRVVPGDEAGGSTASYGTDYRLRGDYNRSTNLGTMTLAKGKTLASLPITVIEDTLIEDTETVVLEMVKMETHVDPGTGVEDTLKGEVGSPNRIAIHIRDDEARPLLKVDEHGTVLRDGVDGGHTIKMALTPAHSSIPDRTLPVDAHFEYCVTSSATLGDDYTLLRPDGTKVKTTGCHLATLPKGELGTYLDLKLHDDGRSDEPDESVKIRLQKSTVSGKETTDLLEIPDSTRTADETISTVITIKDDLPVLAVSGRDDTSKRDRRFRAIYTIRSVNGSLPTDLYVKWQVEDTGNVVNDNRKQSLGSSGYKTLVRGFSEFTVTIGLRHDAGPGSATFRVTPAGRPFRAAPGSDCVRINGGLCPVGNNAPAVQVPDTSVSNLQVTAVDDASASVSWDAVAHATSYEVSWDGSGSQTAVSGVESVTGTSATIRHEAEEAMTLTVTVTPEYIDGDGVTQGFAALAATATLAVGQGSPEQAEEPEAQTRTCVSDALLADVEHRIRNAGSPAGVERWTRVKNALTGQANAITLAEVKAIHDRRTQHGWSTAQWDPVIEAMECLANPPQEEAQPAEEEPATPTTPELSLSAGSAVDEGGNATFTVIADPAPQSDLTIAWTVAQSGEYLDAPGAGHRTVTLAAGATSVALSVATVDDAAHEADGSVSVTLGTGTGYTVATGKGSATVAVRDNDATPATPELSLRAGSAVDEGGNATFTVTADPAPQSDLTIAWTVAQSGEYLDAPGAGHRTVTLAAGATSVALSVATVDDAADEADGSVSVTLGTGTGYTVATGKGNSAVAVRDNDEPVVSIAAGAGVTEGTSASFTVSASPVPAAPLDVTLSVAQGGDFAASGATGARTVTVPTAGSVTFEVATVDDGTEEPDGAVTATLGTGTGYTVAAAPDNAATVAVADNDAPTSGPTISIADAAMKENQRTGYFKVTLSEKVDWPVHVYYATRDSTPVSAVAGQDYLAWERSWQLRARFRPGETETLIHVVLYNDSHDEDPETFEMVLFDADVNGPPGVSVSIADGVAVGTITNSDPMPAAWLSRFGRTAAEQALDGIAGRIAAQRSAGMEGTLAGRSLSFAPGAQSSGGATGATPGTSSGNDGLAQSDIARAFGAGSLAPAGVGDDGFGHRATPVQTLTMREALLGSHFTATGATDASGGSLALWGRAAHSRFDGHEGSFSLDGEATTAMLGADYARGHWLVGTALMQSSGEGGYADTDVTPRAASQTCPEGVEDVVCSGAVREGDGAVEASLTAAVPYAALEASERLKVWGAAGYGSGEVTLKPAMGGALTSDITWTMAAAGARSALLGPPRGEGSGLALALTSDALWARTSSEKTHELAASDSDVTRLRLGLEGRWRNALEGGGHFTPKLEAGMRHDGGDAETGFGIELGGGLAWSAPGLGLNLDVSGRTLLAHGDDDLKDRGFAASMAFDPDPGSERGPSLSLGQSFGAQAQGGLDALFAVDPLEDRTGNDAQSRWTAEAAWGFAAFGGRFTGSPHAGVGLSTGTRDYTLGWRLTPAAGANAPEVSFGARATLRERDAASPEHIIGLEAAARW